MKIRHDQLAAKLEHTFPAFVCIYGDEPLLQIEAENTLRREAVTYQFDERIKLTPNSAADWEEFLSSYYERSLFAERTLLECYLGNGKIGKPGSAAIRQCLSKPATDKSLLLVGEKWETGISQSAWMKAFAKSGWVMPVYKLPLDQYGSWIKNRIYSKKQQITPAGLDLLIEYTQGNLLAANQATNLLATLSDGPAISADLVKQAIAADSKSNLFDMVDAILAGDQLQACRHLNKLKQAGNDPILVIWAIAKQLRELLQMQQQLLRGQDLSAILQQFKVWHHKKPLLSKALSQGKVKDWLSGLEALLAADKIVKGITKGEIWDNLLQLTMQLSRITATHAH